MNQSEAQAIIDGNEPLVIPQGDVLVLTSQLFVRAGTRIVLDGTIVKGFFTTDGTLAAGIRNVDLTVKANDVTVRGSGRYMVNADGGGKMFSLFGDRLVINGITIGPYNRGQALMLAGDDMTIRRLKIGPTPPTSGTGAIRITGGNRIRVKDCIVHCGDDALMAPVPAFSVNDPLYGMDANDITYRDCRGSSSVGRFLMARCSVGGERSATNLRFFGCHGTAGKRGVVIGERSDLDPAGTLSDVLVQDCSVRMVGGDDTNNQEVLVRAANNVTFFRFHLLDPVNEWFNTQGSSDSIVFDRCTFEAADSPGPNGSTISDASNVQLTGCTFKGGGSSNGVFVSAEASDTSIIGCDLSAVTSPTPIRDLGSNSVVSGNVLP